MTKHKRILTLSWEHYGNNHIMGLIKTTHRIDGYTTLEKETTLEDIEDVNAYIQELSRVAKSKQYSRNK